MSSEEKVINTPTRTKTPKTPGTPGTPDNANGVSNDDLLDHLQRRAQVFNQLWQAVEKVQGDSISVATWKAKLKELDDAKLIIVELEVRLGKEVRSAPTLCAKYKGKIIPLNTAHDGRPILMKEENSIEN